MGDIIAIKPYGTFVSITTLAQDQASDSQVPTPPATDSSKMPPPLPSESQLRRNEEELVHDAPAHGLTTSPEDETEDEDEPPVIAESSEPAKSEDVAAEAAARSLSLQSEHPAQPRKRKSPVLPRKDPYIVSDDEPLRKRTRASTTAQDDRDDTKGSPDPKKSPPGSNVEDKGNDHDEQPKAASDGSTVKSTDSKDEVTEVSEDEIVVARPSSRSKKSTQPSSSAGLSSTPTPTPFRACPFLHTPSRTILLSHLSPDADTKKCLRKQGVTIKDDAKPRDNFLCVVEEKKSQGLESIPTTFKVMKTLLAKKLVVSESWMLESIEDDELLDPSSYVVVDGRDCDRSSLYSGLTVFFTSKVCILSIYFPCER